MKKMLFILVLLMVVSTPTYAEEDWATRPIPYEIEAKVVCVLDGCMMNLASCNTRAANQLREVIRLKMFKEGLATEQTFNYLVSVYGEKVLAAPPKRGFNWVVWLTPFIATIGGGALIYLGLEKWVVTSKDNDDEDEDEKILNAPDLNYEKKLNEQIKKYL